MNFNSELKAIYHIHNINTYPILAEIVPTSICTHSCYFCYNKNERENKRQHVDWNGMSSFLRQMAHLGLKSVMIGGGGEPLLYPRICDLLSLINELELEVAIITNGEFIEKIFPYINHRWKFVRISLDAYDAENYAMVHGNGMSDRHFVDMWNKIIKKTQQLINLPAVTENPSLRIGFGYVLGIRNDNKSDVLDFLNYLDRRRIVDHIQFRTDINAIHYNPDLEYIRTLVKQQALKNIEIMISARNSRILYKGICYGSRLATCIFYNGSLIPCCMRPDIVIGDIHDNFNDIWHNYKNNLNPKIDTSTCPNCRIHKYNKLLNNFFERDFHINMI